MEQSLSRYDVETRIDTNKTQTTVLCAEQSVQAAAKFTTKRRIRGKRETALCRFEKEHEIYHIVNSFENIFGFSSKRFKQP
jgi:hypothetical protein